MALISTSELIGFCRRVGTSLRSGVDIRRVWETESRSGSSAYRAAMNGILERIKLGDPLTVAMRDTDFFPPVTLAMLEIGEHTGKVDEVLLRLADHYEHQARLRRQFLFGIAWPAIQLVAAVLIIGGLIYALGVVAGITNSEPVDISGIGLTGTRGALIYFLIVGIFFSGAAALVYSLARGWLGPRPVQLAMHLPLLGPGLRHTAMSRLTWSLGMALDAGMDAKRSAELSILATQNPFYLSKTDPVVTSIAQNREFYEAFRDAQGFPDDFLLELQTAEIAGTLSESLVRMSKDYDERARRSLQAFTAAATFLIMGAVMVLFVILIFRLAWFVYFKPIYELLDEDKFGS
jgi:type IV pilus assembly protein PilC